MKATCAQRERPELCFQTDGQWWFVWETDNGIFQDAYTVSDDYSDIGPVETP